MEKKEENLKRLKAQNEAFEMLFGLLAETGDPRFVYQKKYIDFRNKLGDLTTDDEITDTKFNKLSDLIDQFNKLVDDVLKEDD